MCRCGEHQCFQQMALKLPLSMQKELIYDNKVVQENDRHNGDLPKADLYRKTMYRLDYCEQPDIIDCVPLQQPRQSDNMKFNSTFGYPVKVSIYRDDYIPWCLEDQELCRAKLHVPDYIHSRNSQCDESGNIPRCPTEGEYNYYCPPHCLGNKMPEKNENCLLGHERQFNLGPPVQRTTPLPGKSPHPFTKYSNYMLDYKGSKILPKRRQVKCTTNFEKPHYHVSSDTTYRDAFTCPPDRVQKPQKKGSQGDTLTVGDGPMVQQSSSMLDYADPDVRLHKPERPPRHVYQPPACSMETTTTTGSTYKRWKDLPGREKPKVQNDENASYISTETDVRRLITTYQEDFDGIKSVRCPCRIVEKYGPKVLQPVCQYKKSNSLHDIFSCTNDFEERNKICLV